jgi:agmatinase
VTADSIKEVLSRYPEAKILLLGLPYDESSSFMQGTAAAPKKVREALYSPATTLWTETGFDLSIGECLIDAGDMEIGMAQDSFGEIFAAALAIAETDIKPIFIGGDHFVTWPVIRALSTKYHDLTILHLDAHPDLYDELDGNRNSHACPFARIMEENIVARLVQVGIRGMTGHQREQARRFNVTVLEMKDSKAVQNLKIEGPLYISFDLDALDPAFAPGVSHHEPGGLSTREAIGIIHGISVPIVGADVVEFNPLRDVGGVTAAVSAKLVKEIAGKMLSR